MALGLYSSSLCGVVVLTPSIQAQANKDIIKNANMSTEFHFSQVCLYIFFLLNYKSINDNIYFIVRIARYWVFKP